MDCPGGYTDCTRFTETFMARNLIGYVRVSTDKPGSPSSASRCRSTRWSGSRRPKALN